MSDRPSPGTWVQTLRDAVAGRFDIEPEHSPAVAYSTDSQQEDDPVMVEEET